MKISCFILLLPLAALAQSYPPRNLPARSIPVPTTVSPQLQAAIARPWAGSPAPVHMTTGQWHDYVRQRSDVRMPYLRKIEAWFHGSFKEARVAGVHAYWITPSEIAPENTNRLLVYVHGGAYVLNGGEHVVTEAMLMAHYGKIKVISVDYRMAPDFPFPAALDDTLAVWREMLKTHPAKNMGLFGTSAGGGLTLAAVMSLRDHHEPIPGAIMGGTPWSDLTKTGDTYYTHEYIDNVLGTNDGHLEAEARLYAGDHDLKEPLLSPIYGDFTGFPPSILLSGTRDLFLSNTVRVHQKMLKAGVTAELLVFEGESHSQYSLVPDAPESADAFTEVSRFFDRNLGR